MKELIEVRLHGRGGQGTVTLAALLVDAAFRAGWNVVGFPSFGTERTGAPVAAFVRLSREPIRDRSEVRHPSVVVVQDSTLVSAVDVLAGLEPDGIVALNANALPEQLRDVPKAIAVPVTGLAVEHLGSPILSTAMLAVFAAVTSIVGIEEVCAAIRARFTGSKGEANETLARAAYADALARKEAAA